MPDVVDVMPVENQYRHLPRGEPLPGGDSDFILDDGAASSSGSKYVVIGDPHIGPRKINGRHSDTYDRIVINSLRTVYARAAASGICCVIILGDLFNRVTVSPYYVGSVNAIFEAAFSRGIHSYVLAGNHDVEGIESALWYLTTCVNTLHAPCVASLSGTGGYACTEKIAVAPYIHGRSAESVIVEAIGNVRSAVHVLVCHYGIYDTAYETNDWVKHDSSYISASTLCKICSKSGISQVLAGHRHSWAVSTYDGVRCISVGALTPTSVSERGYWYGNISVVNRVVCDDVKVDLIANGCPGLRYVTRSEYIAYGDNDCLSLVVDMPHDELDDLDNCEVGCLGIAKRKSECGSINVRPITSVRDAIFQTAINIPRTKMCYGIAQDALSVYYGSKLTSVEPVESLPEVLQNGICGEGR